MDTYNPNAIEKNGKKFGRKRKPSKQKSIKKKRNSMH